MEIANRGYPYQLRVAVGIPSNPLPLVFVENGASGVGENRPESKSVLTGCKIQGRRPVKGSAGGMKTAASYPPALSLRESPDLVLAKLALEKEPI